MMTLRKMSVFTLLLCSSSFAGATDIEPMLMIGYESGGSELVTTTTFDLSAGGGISLGGGVSISQPGSSLSTRMTFGYLFDSVDFTGPEGEATFDTFPFSLGLFNTLDRHEFGAGLTYHISPTFEISSSGSSSPFYNFTRDYDSAVGVYLEYHYIFSRSQTAAYTTDTFVGFKATSIEYEKRGFKDINGDSVGIYLGSKF